LRDGVTSDERERVKALETATAIALDTAKTAENPKTRLDHSLRSATPAVEGPLSESAPKDNPPKHQSDALLNRHLVHLCSGIDISSDLIQGSRLRRIKSIGSLVLELSSLANMRLITTASSIVSHAWRKTQDCFGENGQRRLARRDNQNRPHDIRHLHGNFRLILVRRRS